MTPEAPYRVPTDEELAAALGRPLSYGDWASDVLLRPNGSILCELGEPEGRSFLRDASDVVDELNALLAEVRAGRAAAACTCGEPSCEALEDYYAARAKTDALGVGL